MYCGENDSSKGEATNFLLTPSSPVVTFDDLLVFLSRLPPGDYMEEILEEPLDLSIKRATDLQEIDMKSPTSECSVGSACDNEDATDDESDKSEDQRLYNMLRVNPNINEKHLKNRNTPVLWHFLLLCLTDNKCNPSLIEWVSRPDATFKLKNVPALAALWGRIKKRPKMNADHFKRSLRSYYSRNILRRIEGCQDTYQFIT